MKETNVAEDVFYVLNLAGTIFYLDVGTAKQIEQFLSQAKEPWDFITVDDLAGHEVTVLATGVNAMWSSSPDTRAKDRSMRKVLDAEDKEL